MSGFHPFAVNGHKRCFKPVSGEVGKYPLILVDGGLLDALRARCEVIRQSISQRNGFIFFVTALIIRIAASSRHHPQSSSGHITRLIYREVGKLAQCHPNKFIIAVTSYTEGFHTSWCDA
ncbi:hypothetical protein D3C75_918100 [compost metagenome]